MLGTDHYKGNGDGGGGGGWRAEGEILKQINARETWVKNSCTASSPEKNYELTFQAFSQGRKFMQEISCMENSNKQKFHAAVLKKFIQGKRA